MNSQDKNVTINNPTTYIIQDGDESYDINNLKLPVIFKNKILFTSGRFHGWNYSRESILDAIESTDWNDGKSNELIMDHLNGMASGFVGHVKNQHWDGQYLRGDLYVYDKDKAIKMLVAKWGISPRTDGWARGNDMIKFKFDNFSVVSSPECKATWLHSSHQNIVIGDIAHVINEMVFEEKEKEFWARIKDSNLFDPKTFRRKNIGGGVTLILAKLKGKANKDDPMVVQSVRLAKSKFNESEAKNWVEKHRDDLKNKKQGNEMSEENQNPENLPTEQIPSVENNNVEKPSTQNGPVEPPKIPEPPINNKPAEVNTLSKEQSIEELQELLLKTANKIKAKKDAEANKFPEVNALKEKNSELEKQLKEMKESFENQQKQLKEFQEKITKELMKPGAGNSKPQANMTDEEQRKAKQDFINRLVKDKDVDKDFVKYLKNQQPKSGFNL
ncbi:MAG: hypothetical protein ACTSQY_00945 [Candidatus Odinarchaeia archaeon]